MENTEKSNSEPQGEDNNPWGKEYQKTVPEFRGDSQERSEAESYRPYLRTNPETDKTEKLTPVDELSKEEATQEYMDALLELSSNFTSPEGKNARLTYKNGDVDAPLGYGGGGTNFVQGLYRGIGKDLNYEEIEDDYDDGTGHFSDKYFDRGLAMKYADRILAAESDWRQAGKEHGGHDDIEMELAARKAKAKLTYFESGTRGKLRKVFRHNTHQQLENELTSAESRLRQQSTGAKTSNADARLKDALAYAYAEDFHHGEHKYSHEHTYGRDAAAYQERENEKYNEMFFGDAERQKKIDRAIELRRKLMAEKVIE